MYYACWQGRVSPCHAYLYAYGTKWEAHADLLGLPWEMQRGNLPKCSLNSLWALASCAVTGRTLKKTQEENIHKYLEALWLPCSATEPLPVVAHPVNHATRSSAALTCGSLAAVGPKAIQQHVCGSNTIVKQLGVGQKQGHCGSVVAVACDSGSLMAVTAGGHGPVAVGGCEAVSQPAQVTKSWVSGSALLPFFFPDEQTCRAFIQSVERRWGKDKLSKLPLCTFLLLIDRFVSISKDPSRCTVAWRVTSTWARFCITHMEAHYLQEARRFHKDMPANALTQYKLKGSGKTQEDPRSQACLSNTNVTTMTKFICKKSC